MMGKEILRLFWLDVSWNEADLGVGRVNKCHM